MKTIMPLIILISLSLFLYGQADNWIQIVGDGFGFPTQNTVPEMEVYNGYIYASTSPLGAGLAKLYRSASGDAGTWINVTPPVNGDKSIHSFGTTTLNGGYIWCGTGGPNGLAIFRSHDGQNWIQISKRGFGNTGLYGATPHMVLFQGTGDTIPYLYAGGISHGGVTPAQVWRTPYTNTDSLQWDLLVDFATIDSNVTIASYFYVWGDTIYFGTDGIGQLWQSTNGINFTKNPNVGNGFSDVNNFVLSSLAVFNDTFYITTTNNLGGQLWRSGNGVSWEQITGNAFGEGNSVSELRSLRTSFGKLWLTAYTNTSFSTGTPIWRSDDGLNFIQSNTNGFGNSNNNGKNAITIGFGNYQYFGGPNYTDGGQIWRADMTTGIKETTSTDCSITIKPNPFNNYAQINLCMECPDIVQVDIYTLIGRLVRTIKPSSERQIIIQRDALSNGMYLYKLKTQRGIEKAGKLIIE
ncbi:MAG: T9SS type A sorting domain-containing protein [Bacteroidia bacterium]|nr:T9SS type A sorting domain-containing protein [Bacteroidia bacterium]